MKTISHIALALNILLSSVGFVIQKHYCKEELKDISLFFKADECEMRTTMPADCPFHPVEQEQKAPIDMDCCNNEVELSKVDQESPSIVLDKDFKDPVSQLKVIHDLLISAIPDGDSFPNHFLNFKPPPLVWNLTVSLQTFRC